MTEHAEQMMPRPTAEHQRLARHAGTWKVTSKFYMDPSQPPMESTGTETVELIGDLWNLRRYESSMMGTPFAGVCTIGYEPHNQRYVSTWIDSFTPSLFSLTGEWKGDMLEFRGEAWNAMTGSMLMHRTTERDVGDDERVFEMFCTLPDGNEIKMMTNHYRRV